MRRKTLSNCLKRADLYASDGFETVLRCCGIDGRRRGETLSPEEFACISRCLSEETE
jgi:16S rRNA (adenine1518-N6/adenine1519-N6)-dimethyltransferase